MRSMLIRLNTAGGWLIRMLPWRKSGLSSASSLKRRSHEGKLMKLVLRTQVTK